MERWPGPSIGRDRRRSVWADRTKCVWSGGGVSLGVAGERPCFWSLLEQGFFEDGWGGSWRKHR